MGGRSFVQMLYLSRHRAAVWPALLRTFLPMILTRTLRFVGWLVVSAYGITSCISPPDYPDTPEIEFKSITNKHIVPTDNTADFNRVVISVDYKDGDGDLGLRDTDMEPPYNTNKPDGSLNPDGYNYLCRLQVRNTNNEFEDVVFPPNDPGYDGRYPRLTPDSQGDRKAPLKGTIDYKQDIFANSILGPGSVIRFKVRIKDRALNVSNEVLTSPVTLQ